MKIIDIKKSDLPVRVKLTEGFTSEDSFDIGMIVQITNYKEEWDSVDGMVYEVYTTALVSDFEYNNSIADRKWYDKNGVPCLSIFEASQSDPGRKNFETSIYVMGDDDFFEVVYSREQLEGEIEEIINNIIDDARSKWSSFDEEEEAIRNYTNLIISKL